MELFKIFYQKSGNYFVIQIRNLYKDIHYDKKEIKKYINKRTIYIYSNPIIRINNSEIHIQIINN